jgi:hypothetical protein
MGALSSTLKISRSLTRLSKRAKHLWAEFCRARAEGDDMEALKAWIELTRTQYAIASALDAIHVVTENAFNNHIYQAVDSRESSTGVYKT